MSEGQVRADIEEGLRQSAAGEVVDLGDFIQYATSEPFRNHGGWDMSLQDKSEDEETQLSPWSEAAKTILEALDGGKP